MGPRSRERGKVFTDGDDIWPDLALQWGRAHVSAERISLREGEGGLGLGLQWGRAHVSAESVPANTSASSRSETLQWGRAHVSAERCVPATSISTACCCFNGAALT